MAGARVALYSAGLVGGSYGLFKLIESGGSPAAGANAPGKTAQAGGRFHEAPHLPAAGYRATGEQIYDEKKLMAEVLMSSNTSDLKELKRQTDARRKRIAEEYYAAEYERALKIQQADREREEGRKVLEEKSKKKKEEG